MKSITLVTDGSCLGNPGPGGWACIIRSVDTETELTGGEPQTTNNRMELAAVIAGLSKLEERCIVEVITDSRYVVDGMTKHLNGWKRNGWRISKGGAVKNQDLWERLAALAQTQDLKWTWVRGHANSPDQNRCDGLARGAAGHQQALVENGMSSAPAEKATCATR
jgi:ribonuclease HI